MADPFAGPDILRGVAGGSARSKYEELSLYGGDAISEQYPRLGAVLRRIAGEPQHVTSWLKGSVGEERLGRVLERIPHAWVLHDRAIPGSKANIDHIVVAPSAVFVIDTKRYTGKIRASNGQLRVGGRDRTKLLVGIRRQIAMVESVLKSERDLTMMGVLCFVGGTFETRPPFVVGGTTVHSQRTLRWHLERRGKYTFDDRQRMAGKISDALPPAVS